MKTKYVVFAILAAGAMIAVAIIATNKNIFENDILDPYIDVKAAIGDEFYDPSSIQYRNWKPSTTGYCVEINAKNRYGAYTGFKKIHAILISNEPKKYSIAYSDSVVSVFCNDE